MGFEIDRHGFEREVTPFRHEREDGRDAPTER
jgi:hypothetical protein